jgi:hypothetical protein
LKEARAWYDGVDLYHFRLGLIKSVFMVIIYII